MTTSKGNSRAGRAKKTGGRVTKGAMGIDVAVGRSRFCSSPSPRRTDSFSGQLSVTQTSYLQSAFTELALCTWYLHCYLVFFFILTL